MTGSGKTMTGSGRYDLWYDYEWQCWISLGVTGVTGGNTMTGSVGFDWGYLEQCRI